MTLHADKDLKSNNFRGKKSLYIQRRISIYEENLKSKTKIFRLEKGLFFGSPYFRQLYPKRLNFCTKYYLVIKYQHPEKIKEIKIQYNFFGKNQPLPIITSASRDKWGWGIMPPPRPFSFVKYPRPLRVKVTFLLNIFLFKCQNFHI